MSDASASDHPPSKEVSINHGMLSMLSTAVAIIGGIIGMADECYEHGKNIGADEQNAACGTRT